MIDVFLLLGSNLGDRKVFLRKAAELIGKRVAPVVSASSIYETQSWGKTDEPDYLNQVLLLRTNMEPRKILGEILDIEKDLGRIREVKWGSRVIDIDILFYGSAIIHDPDLSIPHPELHNRMFTLTPLSEIAPDFIHPVFNKSIFQLKNELKSDLHVKKL